MAEMTILPDPSCSFGYPMGQVQELLGEDRAGEFWVWMRDTHRSVGYCSDLLTDEPSGCDCGAIFVKRADLARFLQEAAA